ncbi:MAG: PilZ domain-containing protein [Bacillota bacterium]|nr:PilZ domain-containing protein [Bacillota bacterium]MDW7682995.1 PilZ domain-containing protein [Bacillota bacterium]
MAKKSFLKLQQKIDIILLPAGTRYKSLIQEVEQETLSVTVPYSRGQYIPLHPGEKVNVEFAIKDAVYSFETTVLDRKKSNQVPLLVITRPAMFSRRQRRNFVRLEALLPVHFRTLIKADGSPGSEISDVMQGKTVDISGGGLQVTCSTSVTVARGDTVLISLKPDDGNPRDLSLQGTVTWLKEDTYTRTVRFGVFFTDITEADQERIIGYIFSKMRRRTQR